MAYPRHADGTIVDAKLSRGQKDPGSGTWKWTFCREQGGSAGRLLSFGLTQRAQRLITRPALSPRRCAGLFGQTNGSNTRQRETFLVDGWLTIAYTSMA